MSNETIIVWFSHEYGKESLKIYKEIADKFGYKEGDQVIGDWFELVRENSVLGIEKLTAEHRGEE